MPLKTHKVAKKHPHHYAKVYWPYIPLIAFVAVGLWLGRPFVERSQQGVLSYATNVSADGLLTETNQIRLNQGEQRVILNPELSRAAQAKANDMVTRNYWSHVTPDGKTPWVFIDKTGYQYKKAGENLAYGFGSSNEVLKGWMNSTIHRQTLLNKDYYDVGFGVANSQNYQNAGPETVVVALYAEPGTKPVVTTAVDSFTTDSSYEPDHNTNISKAQTITSGKAPWITFVLGLLGGGACIYVLVHNGVHLRKSLRDGERFVLKHPIFYLTVIAFVAVCALLCHSVGFIR